ALGLRRRDGGAPRRAQRQRRRRARRRRAAGGARRGVESRPLDVTEPDPPFRCACVRAAPRSMLVAMIRDRALALLPATLLALAAIALGGGGAGLKLTAIKSTQNKPSNVAIYFKLQSSSGEPVGG